MRRLLSVITAAALMAAMLVVLQAPAMAQSFRFDDDNDFFDHHHNDFFDDNDFFGNNGFGGGFDQDIGDTGDVDISTGVFGAGNNANQTAAPLQFGNTGNLQNAQGFTQFGSSADDIEFEGSSFSFDPEQNVGSNQGVFQSGAA